MSHENKKEIFEYTYSATQQEEVKKIREKYIHTPKTEDPMETLRRLDSSTTQKGTVISMILGVGGTLIFGTGMCCCLVWSLFLSGVFVGAIGIVCLSAAYPAYAHITKKERDRVAPEILRLTEELMK